MSQDNQTDQADRPNPSRGIPLTEESRGKLGEVIRRRRDARGWTTRQAADKAGISGSTVSLLERGLFEGKVGLLVALARGLETTASALAEEADL